MSTGTVDTIAPKSLILPDISNKNVGGTNNISGQLVISGSQLMLWTKGKWIYFSGLVAVQPVP